MWKRIPQPAPLNINHHPRARASTYCGNRSRAHCRPRDPTYSHYKDRVWANDCYWTRASNHILPGGEAWSPGWQGVWASNNIYASVDFSRAGCRRMASRLGKRSTFIIDLKSCPSENVLLCHLSCPSQNVLCCHHPCSSMSCHRHHHPCHGAYFHT